MRRRQGTLICARSSHRALPRLEKRSICWREASWQVECTECELCLSPFAPCSAASSLRAPEPRPRTALPTERTAEAEALEEEEEAAGAAGVAEAALVAEAAEAPMAVAAG